MELLQEETQMLTVYEERAMRRMLLKLLTLKFGSSAKVTRDVG